MTTLQLLIVCAAGVTALALLVGTVAAHGPRNAIGRGVPVTVHTRQPDDQTIHGVLVAEHDDRLLLEASRYVTTAGDQPIPDTVVVLKSNVSWIQQHPSKD